MAEKKETVKREGPTPANILLTAVRSAVDAGVGPDKVVIMLDMAITATEDTGDDRPRQQASTWRDVANTLNKWAATARDSTPAQ